MHALVLTETERLLVVSLHKKITVIVDRYTIDWVNV